ncbi:hypothetical protein [Burkholderia cepacia]|uniref:hypothetical protein n=1 Tax=Burkholderia cepacia TaxID=292 RepID=UPI00158D245D|nr:hypothetical protein [Burkholderia cepacia]
MSYVLYYSLGAASMAVHWMLITAIGAILRRDGFTVRQTSVDNQIIIYTNRNNRSATMARFPNFSQGSTEIVRFAFSGRPRGHRNKA